MTINEENNAVDISASEIESDQAQLSDRVHQQDPKAEFSASEAREKFSDSEIFVDDERVGRFSRILRRETLTLKDFFSRRSSQGIIRDSRFSTLQKALAVAIIIVASLLVYALFQSPEKHFNASQSISGNQKVPVVQPSFPSQSTVADSAQAGPEQIPESKSMLLPTQPRSIEVARSFYLQGDYGRAYATYEQLLPALPASDQFLRDYLKLEMALCAKAAGDLSKASQILSMISHSRSPAVKIMANYYFSLIEIQRKRFLRARTKAYNAISLIKAVDFDDDWALSFESDCHFMVAESLCRRILFLSNTDSNLPADLWGNSNASPRPFDKFKGIELRRFIRSGSENMDKALLGPFIRRLENPNGPPRWTVISYGAPLEELIAKFAAAANLDVYWAIQGTSELVSAEDAARQRAVTLYLPAATPHQVVLVAAGCAGLLAGMEDNPDRLKITIYDPVVYSSLNEYLSLMSRQAISLWQQFVLKFYNDDRLGNAHFVMGLLHSQLGQTTEAMAEYKLVANRFSLTSLAPYALLHSGQLKVNLRDHYGARGDLKQLIEQYPDTEVYDQAYWHLADATMKVGLKIEAALLYQKVHNVGLSSDLKEISALKAARCFYEAERYEEAAKWLKQYINLAEENKGSDLYSAYFLLGHTNLALGQHQQAYQAFQNVLVEECPRWQFIDAVAALVQSHIEQEHFLEALNALENLHSVTLSEEQSVNMMLLKSKIFRMLGLIDEAMIALRERAGYVSDEQLDAKISYELALCYIAKGDMERARSTLSEVLSVVESGPLAHKAAQTLSDVCVKLNQDQQAISVCLKLLESDPSDEIKQNTLRILARAYQEQEEYDKAALVLSGQWK